MTQYWLGFLSGFATLACLGILATAAYRGAERGTPMAAGHWPGDYHDGDYHDDDELDRELRNLTKDAA